MEPLAPVIATTILCLFCFCISPELIHECKCKHVVALPRVVPAALAGTVTADRYQRIGIAPVDRCVFKQLKAHTDTAADLCAVKRQRIVQFAILVVFGAADQVTESRPDLERKFFLVVLE